MSQDMRIGTDFPVIQRIYLYAMDTYSKHNILKLNRNGSHRTRELPHMSVALENNCIIVSH